MHEAIDTMNGADEKLEQLQLRDDAFQGQGQPTSLRA